MSLNSAYSFLQENSDQLGYISSSETSMYGAISVVVNVCGSAIDADKTSIFPAEVDCILAYAVKFCSCSLSTSSLSIKRDNVAGVPYGLQREGNTNIS